MLLILSDQFDVHADVVQKQLLQASIDHFRLNLDTQSLKCTYATYNGEHWIIETEAGILDSTKVSTVWVRRSSVDLSIEERQIHTPDMLIWCAEWNKTLSGIYYALQNARWLNPLREAHRAENKYLQMTLARELGMLTPNTIVSNQKEQLLTFAKKYRYVALKLMSQDLYVDTDGKIKGIFVNRLTVDELASFGLEAENPIVLQEYVEKQFEVRYTVVGNAHHVCRIESQASTKANIDWRRYDLPHTPHSIIEPPMVVRMQVEQLMQSLVLQFGALDFIVTDKGDWYFLEINPSGQWLWIEDLTGLPIAGSIVEWIQNSVSNR